jgi:micrococcal nuclease
MNPLYRYNAVITNVVDGDTIDALVDLGFNIQSKIRFRLYGIDTPELRSVVAEERVAANLSKTQLQSMVLNKNVTLKTYRPDKYGRWLAEIFVENNNVNQQLVEALYAKTYKI